MTNTLMDLQIHALSSTKDYSSLLDILGHRASSSQANVGIKNAEHADIISREKMVMMILSSFHATYFYLMIRSLCSSSVKK